MVAMTMNRSQMLNETPKLMVDGNNSDDDDDGCDHIDCMADGMRKLILIVTWQII